ncbi:MAG: hypothetical protein LM590_12395, partial [Thermofilum sp.]|nr:hypothetical protein [Thermofilum sp.]
WATYEALEALSFLNALNRVTDWSKTVEFILSLQAEDGGFRNRIGDSTSYLRFTYYALRSLYILNSINKVNKDKVLKYIMSCYKNGAFSDRPEWEEWVDATFWGVKALEILNSLGKIDSDRVADDIISWLKERGGSMGYLEGDYFAVMTLQTLGKLNKLNKAKLISNIMLYKNPVSEAFKGWSTLYHTEHALKILSNINMLGRINIEKVKQFILNMPFYYMSTGDIHSAVYSLKMLNALQYIDNGRILNELLKHQSPDGGFKGGESWTQPDIWETYLAVDTLHMLNILSSIDKTKVANYVLSLKNPDGSFKYSKNSGWYDRATPLAAMTLILLGYSELVDEKTINFILLSQRADGGFGDILNTYLSLKVLDYFKRLDKNVLTKAVRYVLSLHNLDGGFGWWTGDMWSWLDSTDYGVSVLKEFAAYRVDVKLVPPVIAEYSVSVDVKPRISDVIVDDVLYPRRWLPLTFECEKGSSHTLQVVADTRIIDYGNWTRRVFEGWYEDGKLISSELSLTLSVDRSRSLEARWRTQYLVTVSTPHSTVEGEGWYSAGSFAEVRLAETEVGGPLVRYVFEGWEGLRHEDRVLGPGVVSVYVDGPRVLNAVWRVDYSRAYALAFILIAGVVAVGFLAFSRRRRGVAAATAAATQPPSGEAAQPPVEKATTVAAAPFDALKAEIEKYEEYLRRLEDLKAGGRVSERAYQALKSEYEVKIQELKKKLGLAGSS